MGDWILVIEGTGQHHNQGDSRDADVLSDQAVKMFLAAGQNLKVAHFTSGGRLELATKVYEDALDAR